MGVQGLLPQLRPMTARVNLKEYEGKRVAVDASVWLHRGTYACAVELFRGVKTTK